MNSRKLAFVTVGVLHEPVGSERVQGFVDRIPAVYGAADQTPGFVARSFRDPTTWEHTWGKPILPRCFDYQIENDRIALTLSLWDDLESVAAFAYAGPHGEALTKSKEWFVGHDLPDYAAWWVEDGHTMTFQEGADKVDALYVNGPTPAAFNFANPFDVNGEPCRLDRNRVKAKQLAR